ncbi:hypothetical protein HDV05_003267 [Chytridiales sp. JEL 0842]|nr:hypothetical protein HDV05_003267 [Chytridiales sp. JEL 0842]
MAIGLNPVPVADFTIRRPGGTILGVPTVSLLANSSVPLPVVSSDATAEDVIASAMQRASKLETAKPSQKEKNKYYWRARDSMARRLFIGKEGSRRRQRHDNNTFADHPMVKALDPAILLEPQDFNPAYSMPRRPTIFSHVPKSARHHLMNVNPEVPKAAPTSKNTACIMGENALSKADRRLRRQLRRGNWSCRETLESFEKEVIDFFYSLDADEVNAAAEKETEGCSSGNLDGHLRSEPVPIAQTRRKESSWISASSSSCDSFESTSTLEFESPDEDDENEGWVRVESKTVEGASKPKTAGPADSERLTLAMRIDDKFLRLLVHTMCRYYKLGSHTEEQPDGSKVTIITRLSVLGSKSTIASEGTSSTFQLIEVMPGSTFAEYLFD